MKRILVLILFLFTVCKLSAKEMKWFAGSVVLETREVLVGEIAVETHHDLILFRADNQVHVLPAHKIESVQFYDGDENVNRKFVSVQETNLVWKVHRLYEVVVFGDVIVLRKEKTLTTSKKSDAHDFVYFIRYANETVDVKSFRTKVYPAIVKDGGPLLSMFMLDHRLNPNNASNAIQIIKYYNHLKSEDQALARY